MVFFKRLLHFHHFSSTCLVEITDSKKTHSWCRSWIWPFLSRVPFSTGPDRGTKLGTIMGSSAKDTPYPPERRVEKWFKTHSNVAELVWNMFAVRVCSLQANDLQIECSTGIRTTDPTIEIKQNYIMNHHKKMHKKLHAIRTYAIDIIIISTVVCCVFNSSSSADGLPAIVWVNFDQ